MPAQDFEETHLQLTWDADYVGSAASTDAKGSYVFSDGSDGDGKKASVATKSRKISEGVISVIRSAETIQPGAVSRIQLRIGKNGAGGVGDFDLGITTVETAQRRSRLGEAAENKSLTGDSKLVECCITTRVMISRENLEHCFRTALHAGDVVTLIVDLRTRAGPDTVSTRCLHGGYLGWLHMEVNARRVLDQQIPTHPGSAGAGTGAAAKKPGAKKGKAKKKTAPKERAYRVAAAMRESGVSLSFI